MKFNFSSKTISLITTGAITSLFIAGLSTPAFADSNNAQKSTAAKNSKPAEIIIAESKVDDSIAKAPADADFKKLDRNGDEKISLKEAVKDKTLATVFDVADANHDGMITTDEYASYKAASAVKTTESAPAGY
ncbi:MAG: EF-hand domain-containing protein [Methylotenera sp.]